MTLYRLISERMYDPKTGHYLAYGIAAEYETGSRTISDISADPEKASALADALNRWQPDPSQLDEIIENFLYDFEI